MNWLIVQRRFAPLFWSHSLGVLNDTLLRVFFLLLMLAALPDESRSVGGPMAVAVTLFMLPFLLFSAWGGALADCLDKPRLIRRLKLFELAIVLLAVPLIWWHSRWLLCALLLLMGFQAALLGPVKYALLPQLLSPTELVRGNAWFGCATFAAILVATLLSISLTMMLPSSARLLAMVILLSSAVLGLLASLRIPATTQPGARGVPQGPLASIRPVLVDGWRARPLLPAMLGIAMFWFLVTCYLTQLPDWASLLAGGEVAVLPLLLTAFVLGIVAGAMLCARLSAGRLELGLVTLGALVMGAGSLWLAGVAVPAGGEAGGELLQQRSFWWILAALWIVGLGGGLYSVPLYALIQLRSDEPQRARLIAANHLFNALLSVVAVGFGLLVLRLFGSSVATFFASVGVITLLIGLGLLIRHPRPLLRLLIFALMHLTYRLKFRGRQHIPARGAALVVCNHVSFMDALVIGGASPRPLRFLMDRPIYESPWLNWWFRIVGAIPVDADRRDPGSVRRALDEVSRALRQGEVVMLFPEGRLTPDGTIQHFRRGLDMILARDPVPVVPAGLAGLWGSWTSHQDGKALTKWPRRFRARVVLYFGEPVTPRKARCGELEAQVRALKAEADEWLAVGYAASNAPK